MQSGGLCLEHYHPEIKIVVQGWEGGLQGSYAKTVDTGLTQDVTGSSQVEVSPSS